MSSTSPSTPSSPPLTLHLLPPPNPSLTLHSPDHLASLALSPTTPAHNIPSTLLAASSLAAIPPLFLSALRIRIPVFIHEQRCALASEIDADDSRSWHWIAFYGDKEAATLRVVPPGLSPRQEEGYGGVGREEGRRTEPYRGKTALWDGREPYVKIGRVATLPEYRGRGIAVRLLDAALEDAGEHRERFSGAAGEGGEEWRGLVLSHAQRSVRGWWERMGFVEDEGMGVWWEEGIEHVGMWRRV
ncbi:MAG: hypothetical protein Q9219_004447 [cf. Caloplaca sp. 3 TL-2023]